MCDDEDLYCNPETNIFLQQKLANKPKAPVKSDKLSIFKRKTPMKDPSPIPCSEESAEDELANLFKSGLKRPSEFRKGPVVPMEKREVPVIPVKPAVFPPMQKNEDITPSRLRHVEGPFSRQLCNDPTEECEIVPGTEIGIENKTHSPMPPPPIIPKRTSQLLNSASSQESLKDTPTSALNDEQASTKMSNLPVLPCHNKEPPVETLNQNDTSEFGYPSPPSLDQTIERPKRRALKLISAPPRIPIETFPGLSYNPDQEDDDEMYAENDLDMYPINLILPPAPKPDDIDAENDELYADTDYPEPAEPHILPPSTPAPAPPAPPSLAPPSLAPPSHAPPSPAPPSQDDIIDDTDLELAFDDELYAENDVPYDPELEDDEELYADPDFAETIAQPDPTPQPIIPSISEYKEEDEDDEDIYEDIDDYLKNKQVKNILNNDSILPPPEIPHLPPGVPDLPQTAPPPVTKEKKGLFSIFKKKKDSVKNKDNLLVDNAVSDERSHGSEKSSTDNKSEERPGTPFEDPDDEIYADEDYPDCDDIYEIED